ncbi:hypothetical protein GCM10009754_05550 [Amycolatopsis minnesotensis]|uniref:Uncharacterized protein n=1 Tax=Amycolatopsis minnesotensis TaxID=337894 RepID=A0ABP5BFS7_9PSEU
MGAFAASGSLKGSFGACGLEQSGHAKATSAAFTPLKVPFRGTSAETGPRRGCEIPARAVKDAFGA